MIKAIKHHPSFPSFQIFLCYFCILWIIFVDATVIKIAITSHQFAFQCLSFFFSLSLLSLFSLPFPFPVFFYLLFFRFFLFIWNTCSMQLLFYTLCVIFSSERLFVYHVISCCILFSLSYFDFILFIVRERKGEREREKER